MNQLEIERVHWVGFESGGILGMQFAATFPDRTSSLVLVNSPSATYTEGRLASSLAKGSPTVSDAIDRIGLPRWLMETMPNRIDLNHATPSLIEWHVREQSKTPIEVAKAIIELVQRIDLGSIAPRVIAPTLLMAGELSPNCPPEEQLEMARSIPNARKPVVFPSIGVGIQLLIPDACVAEVLKFLDTV